MKSFQILLSSHIPDAHNYSDLQILSSGAGYYIGTTYRTATFTEPGSRDSGYFDSKLEAEQALGLLHKMAINPIYDNQHIQSFLSDWELACGNIGIKAYYRLHP